MQDGLPDRNAGLQVGLQPDGLPDRKTGLWVGLQPDAVDRTNGAHWRRRAAA
jgi:hypothetical protein